MNREMEELLRAMVYASVSSVSPAPLSSQVTPQTQAEPVRVAPSSGAMTGDAASVAAEARRLVDLVTPPPASLAAPAPSSGSSQEPSTAETVLRTAAMMTGVGPLITGVMKLFGSGDPEPLPALEKFQLAPSVSVEAGLTGNREYSSLRYTEGGLPGEVSSSSPERSGAPTIQVNIQAMDSRSFLDRQDDIARAVREAMLHSNSLNDVVVEL